MLPTGSSLLPRVLLGRALFLGPRRERVLVAERRVAEIVGDLAALAAEQPKRPSARGASGASARAQPIRHAHDTVAEGV